jgi:porin
VLKLRETVITVVKNWLFYQSVSKELLGIFMMCFSLNAVANDDTDSNNSLLSSTAQSSDLADWQARSTLTGDWGGARSSLSEKGVDFDLRRTSFYQGLASGTGGNNYEYGGKFDVFINLDSEKLGLWEGGGFRSHTEYRYGNAQANLGGAIFAVNTALFWPGDTPDELVATSLYVTQKLGDKSSIAIGKFNPVDLLATDPFYGGWGIDRFMNLILAAPPSGLIPVVFMGGVANIKTDPVSWTIMVFDPDDRTFDYFPGDLFENGVNVSVSGAHITTLAGRKTTYAVTGLYSTAEGTDYSELAPGIGSTSTKTGSYNISFEFKHNLQESTTMPNASWGVYFKVATADGNPNYVQSSVIAGIGGRALFFGRPQDSFGLGVYRYNLSDVLQDSLSPFTQFTDESAVEVFYSYAVTPWLLISPDIQYIKPASGGFDNALVLALRAQIRF